MWPRIEFGTFFIDKVTSKISFTQTLDSLVLHWLEISAYYHDYGNFVKVVFSDNYNTKTYKDFSYRKRNNNNVSHVKYQLQTCLSLFYLLISLANFALGKKLRQKY